MHVEYDSTLVAWNSSDMQLLCMLSEGPQVSAVWSAKRGVSKLI